MNVMWRICILAYSLFLKSNAVTELKVNLLSLPEKGS